MKSLDRGHMERIKIACVSYLNTLPLIEGLKAMEEDGSIELIKVIPAKCAELFQMGAVDLALIPSQALNTLSDYQIATDYCIASSGSVKTVGIFSDSEMNDIHTIYLDNDSLTSRAMCRILMQNHWKKDPTYIDIDFGISDVLPEEGVGYLMIGDKAFSAYRHFNHCFDLGSAWKAYSGLDFVYAVWIARRDISHEIIETLNEKMREGLDDMDILTARLQESYAELNLQMYFNTNIKYQLDDNKISGLQLFLKEEAALLLTT